MLRRAVVISVVCILSACSSDENAGSGGGAANGGTSRGGTSGSGGISTGNGGAPASSGGTSVNTGGRAAGGVGGAPGSGGAGTGGQGGQDAAVPANGGVGGSGGAAARTFPTDRNAFGLGAASRCAGAGVLFCEDFEGDTVDTAKWDLQTWGSGSATIDSARAARGKHSVHIAQPSDVSRVMLRETSTFATTGNHFFGRFFLYLDYTEDPLDCHTGTCVNLVHWTVASAGGDYVEGGQTYHPDVRAVGAVNQNLLVNLDGGPKPEVGVSDDGSVAGYESVDASHRNQWMCFEFEYGGEGATGEVRVYWDGIEHPGLHYSTANRGDKGELWPIPKYDYAEFGFTHYQNYPSVSSFDAWLDEIVVDDERIGCAL